MALGYLDNYASPITYSHKMANNGRILDFKVSKEASRPPGYNGNI